MNEIPIIKKESIKDYCLSGFVGGFYTGSLYFLLSLINNSTLDSLYSGFIIWAGITILFGFAFIYEEYFKRKRKIKKLTSEKYAFLRENDFSLHPDLFFEGFYRKYFFRVLPMSSWVKKGIIEKEIEFIVIQSFYSSDSEIIDDKREENMSGNYFIGEIHFTYHCAEFIPKDWENPDFQKNFDGLIGILKREHLEPMMKDEWENSFGNKLEQDRKNKEIAQTMQILKIGKLNITYRKSDK